MTQLSIRQRTVDTSGLRRYPRVELGAGIWTEIWRGRIGQDRAASGALTTLGAGGAFVDTHEAFEVGASICVSFTLPDGGSQMICNALIRTAIPNQGIGIEFVRMTNGDLERLLMATWELADPAASSPWCPSADQ